MKRLEKTLIALAVLLILFVSVAYLLPHHSHAERSILIHATPAQIHTYVEDLKEWQKWMPWTHEMDPTVQYTYEGSEKGKGAVTHWKAEKMGSGSLNIIESDPGRGVWYTLIFGDNRPCAGSITYEANGPDDTKVTWTHESEVGNNPVGRYMAILMKTMIEADFEKGLAKLKQQVEAHE